MNRKGFNEIWLAGQVCLDQDAFVPVQCQAFYNAPDCGRAPSKGQTRN
jgi:hypothetical protein